MTAIFLFSAGEGKKKKKEEGIRRKIYRVYLLLGVQSRLNAIFWIEQMQEAHLFACMNEFFFGTICIEISDQMIVLAYLNISLYWCVTFHV